MNTQVSTTYKAMHDAIPHDNTTVLLEAGTLHHSTHSSTLSWSNLSYTVGSKEKKMILKDVSGRCGSGELLAVMGPSGSGKTTLLDILADRIGTGTIEGTIVVNGELRQTKTFRAITSYVSQEDSLLGSFTVLETLRMAAKLSLPHSITEQIIEERVMAVINAMGLESCQETIVGDIFRKGLSGGQKRRLSIAIELLSNPSILLLDEPTSGLDSSSTFNVMKFIKQLTAVEKKTVICTIHQPSSLVYDMFTHLMILSTGSTVYHGLRQDALNHFSTLGYACPTYSNPAEYYIELVNSDFEGHADIPKLVNSYTNSQSADLIQAQIIQDRNQVADNQPITIQKPSPSRQFMVLMYRNTLNNIRNPGIYWVRLFMYFCLSGMVGTMYLSTNKSISDNDLVPLLFYVQAFLVFMSVAVLPFFIEQREVFIRERTNSSLNVFSFVMANFIATLPGIFLIASLSTGLVIALAGLNSGWWFLLNLFLSLVVAESLMHVIGAAVPHYIIGIALGAGIFGMFMLCEGFMVPYHSIPKQWIWGYYIAFHTYSFETFMYQQFNGVETQEARAILVRWGMDSTLDVDRFSKKRARGRERGRQEDSSNEDDNRGIVGKRE